MINSGTRLDKHGIPYAIFSDFVEEEVMQQFSNVVQAEGVVRAALMPDCHVGYTSPVGCVVETKGIIYPAVVGYDIGCGVLSVPIPIPYELVWDNAVAIRNQILNVLHVGVGRNYEGKGFSYQGTGRFGEYERDIGTLGGGNHFLEIGVDDVTKQVWVTVHSGSRGFGHRIGTKYMGIAAELNNSTNLEGLNGFKTTDRLANEYRIDHDSARDFAEINRATIIRNVVTVLSNAYGPLPIKSGSEVSCIHNILEFTKAGTVIHRKGATKAGKDERVAIPGSMRDGVIIGIGTGLEESIQSCSHGAGRKLSRAQTKATVTLEEFQKSMEGIPGAGVSRSHLDECPAAYKDIASVMDLQTDAVKSLLTIRPIINIKG